MKRAEMIKEKKYFNYIIRNGKFIKDKNFVIYYVKNTEENHFTHFGIALKNSIGNAVTRNLLKRQTRSIIDNNRKLFQKDKDYIIMIREGCLKIPFNKMEQSIVDLMKG
jgi:ribonuclease P protein component